MAVYNSATQADVFRDARVDMVASLNTFIETLKESNVVPNLTAAHDSHTINGVPTPYATVGVVRADFENYGSGASTYDIMVRLQMQIFLHFSPMGDIYDERLRWDLMNSLFNYYKNVQRISTNFDGLFIRSIEGDVQFPVTGTAGAVFNLECWKVVST